MHPQYRDGALALGGLCGLVALAAATVGIGVLVDLLGIAAGVAVAVAVELVFLRYPSRAMGVWERRGVPVAALCLVLAAAVIAVQFVPWLLAVAVWGLLTYLVLLGCVLLGVENPVSVLLRVVE
ncbi:hypothetical protein [Halovenus sp. HT40]|uniref:hypothetical protein n=1 Tax=Halovenus sp. HT40 TaxID=3126691 RepID=UPI00300F7248